MDHKNTYDGSKFIGADSTMHGLLPIAVFTLESFSDPERKGSYTYNAEESLGFVKMALEEITTAPELYKYSEICRYNAFARFPNVFGVAFLGGHVSEQGRNVRGIDFLAYQFRPKGNPELLTFTGDIEENIGKLKEVQREKGTICAAESVVLGRISDRLLFGDHEPLLSPNHTSDFVNSLVRDRSLIPKGLRSSVLTNGSKNRVPS